MADRTPTLTDLAQRGQIQVLEDLWLAALEDSQRDSQDLLGALAALTKRGQGDRAAALGWTWLATYKEQAEPAAVLAVAKDLLVACGDSEELRQEILGLYRTVYEDRPDLELLLETSGLAGGKSPRRALRTLDLCLGLKVGDYLVHRSDEQAVQVVAVDTGMCSYTVRGARGEEYLDGDTLALAYDAVAETDFRVLLQLRPEALTDLVTRDPVQLVIGILQSRQGRIDSDHLEELLSPRLVPAGQWSTWWSKARTALRRCPHVVIEGRNPVILTYHAAGQTLEDEIEPQWAKAQTPAQRMAVVEGYLRELKARRLAASPALVGKLHRELMQRVEVARKGAPADALAEALVIDRMVRGAVLPAEAANPARAILAASDDCVRLLGELADYRFYLQAIELLREIKPDGWAEVYVRLLPVAPQEACDAIAGALHAAGRTEDVRRIAAEVLADFNGRLGAVCWLWRGPAVEALEPIPRAELLPRLVEYLAMLTRNDYTPAELLRDARTRIRAALSSENYRHYREIIQGMDAGMASTIFRTVDRAEGLGQVVHATLLRIVRETHPQLFAKTRVDPWFDDGLIYCTAEGRQRREAELHHLTHVKIPENAKAIGEAAARGDLSENSEYKFALEERDLLQARVRNIQQEMDLARLLTANDVSTDSVNVGTRVTLATQDGGHRREFTILGPWEADGERGIYNYRAPLCIKLKGLRVGDAVVLELDGVECEYRLERIENALDRPRMPV